MALHGRPSRRRVQFRYLLDGRLFHLLCDPGQAAALETFRASLVRSRLAAAGSLPDFEMTPLAVLDAIGGEPPPVVPMNFPEGPDLRVADLSVKAIEAIKRVFFNVREYQEETLRQLVEERRQRIDPAAHELFDLCVTRSVQSEEWLKELRSHMTLDSLFRLRFPESYREDAFHLFTASLLNRSMSVAGLSKVRLLKVYWDRQYERLLKKSPQSRAEIQAADRELKPRTYPDYLTWDLIHHAVLGYQRERMVQPVIAFTPDSEQVLETRCRAYKTAFRAFLDQLPEDDLRTLLRADLQALNPGWLVSCREDGTLGAPISTGEVRIL